MVVIEKIVVVFGSLDKYIVVVIVKSVVVIIGGMIIFIYIVVKIFSIIDYNIVVGVVYKNIYI